MRSFYQYRDFTRVIYAIYHIYFILPTLDVRVGGVIEHLTMIMSSIPLPKYFRTSLLHKVLPNVVYLTMWFVDYHISPRVYLVCIKR